jgi:hypothetical protein
LLAVCGILTAQTNVLTVNPPEKLRIRRGETVAVTVNAQLRPGYHANSNTPSESYLIPLKLTWAADPLESVEVVYPKARMEKYEFSEKPLSVVSGNFDVVTKFRAPSNASAGPAILTGKLRYQACTEKLCLPPKIVTVPLTVQVQ